MKIFLQDGKTAKFMRCDSMWTVDINEALDFLSVQRAVFFGMKELKDSFQVVQMELSGFSSPVTVMITQPQWPRFQVQPTQPGGLQEQTVPRRNLRRRSSVGDLRIIPLMTPPRFLRVAC
jgi:hypothetical protein